MKTLAGIVSTVSILAILAGSMMLIHSDIPLAVSSGIVSTGVLAIMLSCVVVLLADIRAVLESRANRVPND
jgi:hypothetical protein